MCGFIALVSAISAANQRHAGLQHNIAIAELGAGAPRIDLAGCARFRSALVALEAKDALIEEHEDGENCSAKVRNSQPSNMVMMTMIFALLF